MKYFLSALLFVSPLVSAQTTYTYPGYGYLQDQNGARINTKRYTKMSECVADAYAENNRRKAANPSLLLSAVECVTATGYVTTWPTQPASPGLGRLPVNPVINPGFNGPRVTTTSDRGVPDRDNVGAFRTVCTVSHFAFDDPIVYPGQPGRSHLHMFFGNTGVNAYSTSANVSTTGNSTCAGGTLNRSAYWVPALIDTATGLPVMPSTELAFYYKTGYNGVSSADVKPIPKDLRMIAGDTMSASAGDALVYQWVCHNNYPQHGPSIQDCAVGDELELSVFFPQCWNGRDLDSPDHKSHMAYAQGGCPASHPVALPAISLNIKYPITRAGQAANWRLSSDTYTGPAGYSAHADFWSGWDTNTMQTFVTNCINRGQDCHSYLLGNGQTLY